MTRQANPGEAALRRSGPGWSKGGFTLLELLAAMAITLLLAGLMLTVTTGMLGIWRRTQDSCTTGTTAKLALDQLERDLQSALCRKDGLGNTWLAVDVINAAASLSNHGWQSAAFMKPATAESQRLVPDPASGQVPVIGEARFGLSGVWLRFIAATSESGSEPALPRAISYQLARRPVSGAISPTNPADVRYTLFRTFISNPATFTNGYNVATGYGSSLTNPSTSTDAVAADVVDFGVWFYARDNLGGLRRIFPADNNDRSHAASDATNPVDASRFPEVVDVMVRVLTGEGARLIEGMEKANGAYTRPGNYVSDAEWWWAVVGANSRVFVRRVEIKGGAL